jgi:hypothetical protein
MIPVTELQEPPVNVYDNRDISTLVRFLQDTQKQRVATGNRLVKMLKDVVGIDSNKPEHLRTKLDDEKISTQIIDIVKSELNAFKAKHGVATTKPAFERRCSDNKYVKKFEHYVACNHYMSLEESEDLLEKSLKGALEGHPLWEAMQGDKRFFSIGPKTVAMIVAYINIQKAVYVSKIWKYCGLDVVIDPETEKGIGRGRRKEHLVLRTTTDSEGNEKEFMSLSFNATLKTALVGVCAGNIVRLGTPSNKNKFQPSFLYSIYANYKNRITQRNDLDTARNANNPEFKPLTKAHIEAMARRYVIKHLLRLVYEVWRAAEKLPVNVGYEVAYLGHMHHERVETDELRGSSF